jgi:hypothetical protein
MIKNESRLSITIEFSIVKYFFREQKLNVGYYQETPIPIKPAQSMLRRRWLPTFILTLVTEISKANLVIFDTSNRLGICLASVGLHYGGCMTGISPKHKGSIGAILG